MADRSASLPLAHSVPHTPAGVAVLRDNIIFRLVVYYIAMVVFIGGLMHLFPAIPRYIDEERGRVARTAESKPADLLPAEGEGGGPGLSTTAQLLTPSRSVPVVVALATAFLVTLPVTWVYRWTRPRKRYSQVFAHTLLVVPIGIALVVFLVKGSLALAFSLAGIVAALRFRTSLDEPMDAVYMFIVVGAGLAAGVQLLTIALLASVIFNITALAVWRTNWGEHPAILSGWRLVQPDEAGQLLGVSGVVKPDLARDGDGAKPQFNAKLRVQTTQVEAAQRAAIPILDRSAKHWQVAQVTQMEDGSSVVEFDVRLKKSTDLAAFIREIEQSETAHVGKVELKQQKSNKE